MTVGVPGIPRWAIPLRAMPSRFSWHISGVALCTPPAANWDNKSDVHTIALAIIHRPCRAYRAYERSLSS